MHRTLIACLLVLFADTALAGVILPNLPPGSQYELIFVTADTRDATSPYIADYNTFVRNESISINPLLNYSVQWNAVVSVSDTLDRVTAATNAPSNGIPVYNTQGILVASSSLYLGSLLSPVLYDQYGEIPANNLVYTGSTTSGDYYPGYALGSGDSPRLGLSDRSDSMWIDAGYEGEITASDRFYALSTPITAPAPEPATLTLCGSAILLLALRFLRRQ